VTTTETVTIGWRVWETAPALSDYAPRGGTVVDEGLDDAGRYVIVADFTRVRGKPEAKRQKLYLSALGSAEAPDSFRVENVRKSLCAVLSERFDPDLWRGLLNIMEVMQ